ncbi:MAG: hypothetical protein WA210_21390 [Burkholderiaceae bacterium]
MNTQSYGSSKALRGNRNLVYSVIASAVMAAMALVYVKAQAADPVKKAGPVSFEAIPGSTVKRITLTAKAAERLGIATGKVSEQTVVRRQMMGGLVIPPMDPQSMPQPGGPKGGVFGQAPQSGAANTANFGGFGPKGAAPSSSALKTIAAPMEKPAAPKAAAAGDVWVLVNMAASEWERTAKDKPARLFALSTRDALSGEVLAQPSGFAPTEDPKRSMLSVYYVVPGKDHGLMVNNRMRVELPLMGVEEKQKVVPYSSVYYDGKGTAWVYVSPKPLVFERHKIAVERVAGDLAVLSEGPAVGTTVVSVGASLLFGTEIFGK